MALVYQPLTLLAYVLSLYLLYYWFLSISPPAAACRPLLVAVSVLALLYQ